MTTRNATDRKRRLRTRSNRLDAALIAAFVASSIFTACWLAGFHGFTSWCLGAMAADLTTTAWKALPAQRADREREARRVAR